MKVNEVTNCLNDLKDVLNDFYGCPCRDIGGLDRAIALLKRNSDSIIKKKTPLIINVKNLIFEIPNIHKHSLPVKVSNSLLVLSIVIKFTDDAFNFQEISDLNINIEIKADDENGNPIKSAWHLDYHDVKGNEKFSHPQFHFQFGGQKIRESNQVANSHFNTGELYIMESPRLMHPPLDPVLAIDFIFGNFLGDVSWKKLRSSPKYSLIKEQSKTLLWEPYFKALSDYFIQPKSTRSNSAAGRFNPGL